MRKQNFLQDRGYLYGDGVFDTMRSYRGCVFRFKDHCERLQRNAHAIGICHKIEPSALYNLVIKALKKSALKDAYIRVSLSRGKASGPMPAKNEEPYLSVIVRPAKKYPPGFYKSGVKISVSSIRKNSQAALPGEVKSMNYLNNILAREQTLSRKSFEIVLVTEDGYVTEGAASNIFIVKSGRVITPPSFLGVLEGITRKVVLEIAEKLNIEVVIIPFTCYDIYTSSECFITNTGMGVMPVRMVDARIIGNGSEGDVTKRIRREFLKLIKKGG